MPNTKLWSSQLGDLQFPMTPTTIDGMTIGGTMPAAGTFTLVMGSVLSNITAGTVHTLAGATPLTGQINNITVCATAANSVALPSASAGLVGTALVIFNGGIAAAAVWPQLADAVDGGTAGVAVTLSAAARAIFYCIAVNTWQSALLGAKSA